MSSLTRASIITDFPVKIQLNVMSLTMSAVEDRLVKLREERLAREKARIEKVSYLYKVCPRRQGDPWKLKQVRI